MMENKLEQVQCCKLSSGKIFNSSTGRGRYEFPEWDSVAGNHQELPEPQGISEDQTGNSQKVGDFQSIAPV